MAADRQAKIREALEEIRRQNRGRLTPDAVVKAAKNKNHVLHKEFEWDDAKAAHEQRKARARFLISYVTVVVTTRSEKIVAPRFVRNPTAPRREQGYISTTDSINQEQANAVVLAEFDRCEAAIRRARAVASSLESQHPGIVNKLESMLQELVVLRQRLAA